jgi:hypothetical protein
VEDVDPERDLPAYIQLVDGTLLETRAAETDDLELAAAAEEHSSLDEVGGDADYRVGCANPIILQSDRLGRFGDSVPRLRSPSHSAG